MDFGEVLSRAWEIIWKHKILWIFGIMAGCAGGGSGGGNTGYQFSSGDFNGGPPNQFFERTFGSLSEGQIALIIGAIFLVVLVIIVLAILLGTIGRIGLIRGTLQAEAGSESLSFGELFRGSLPYFWRVFGLSLLVGVLVLVVGLVIAALSFGLVAVTLGIALICLIPLFCLLAIAVWLVQVVVEQASIAIVTEDLGVLDGLQVGWDVFRENLGTMIVMALILYLGVGGVISFILGLPLLLVVFPAVAAVASGAYFESNAVLGGGLAIAALCFVLYLPILIALGGAVRSYIGSAWTLTFLRLRPETPTEEAVVVS